MKFKEVGCSINESEGSIKHTLVLNKPLFTDVTIEVITVSQTTQSELCNMLLYIRDYICTYFIDMYFIVQKL